MVIKRYSSGFVAIIPLLVVSAIVVVALSMRSGIVTEDQKTLVLSESDDANKSPEPQKVEDKEDEDSNSGKGEIKSTEKPEDRETKTPEVKRYENAFRRQGTSTPKPTEKSRTTKTPKPSETPDIEDEDETETEIEIETEVKEGTTTAKVKIQQNGRSFQFEHDGTNVEVQGEFPLSIDDETNILKITTPSGPHDVAVLPDVAVDNIIAAGVVSEVVRDDTGREDVRIIADDEGNPVYTVTGVKTEKLLGFFNVPITKTAHISIRDGQVVKLDQSFISRLLDLVSI